MKSSWWTTLLQRTPEKPSPLSPTLERRTQHRPFDTSPPENAAAPAAARNRGWRAAEADLIAFTDDDCVPLSGWLEEGWNSFRMPGVSGAWVKSSCRSPRWPTDHELNTKGLEAAPCATANCFYAKSALAAVGGFDERFTAAWREDSD